MFMESVSVNCSFAGVSCRCTLLRYGFTAIGCSLLWCGGSRVALCRTQWVQSCRLSTVLSNDALPWPIPGGRRRAYYYGLYRYVSLWRVGISSSLLLRLQNSRIFCEREWRTTFERKVWSVCTAPEMIPTPKWSPTLKWSPNRPWHDPDPEMIPKEWGKGN